MCGVARRLKAKRLGSAQSITISIGIVTSIGIAIGAVISTAWPAGTASCAKMLPAPRGPAGPAALPVPGTLEPTRAMAAQGCFKAASAPHTPNPLSLASSAGSRMLARLGPRAAA